MQESMQIDWLVIFIAAVLNMLIGFVWYSKWLFLDEWSKLSKASMDKKEMKKSIAFGFINSLVIAFFLYYFEYYLNVATVSDGIYVGFIAWLGFAATTQISGVIWAKRPFKLFLIDSGCKLLSFVVMGGVIGA